MTENYQIGGAFISRIKNPKQFACYKDLQWRPEYFSDNLKEEI
jgi:hypothetical protein